MVMNRFKELESILDKGRYFKVVCGAGNEDAEEVYRLCIVYCLAGALGIDVSASVKVVKAAMLGVDKAIELSDMLKIEVPIRPFINVSVGLKGDPHVRKARIIKENCTDCGLCFEHCEQEAIEESLHIVLSHRCIGCGKCADVCDFDAVEFYTNKVDFRDILPRCIEAGAENLELHAIIDNDESVLRDWKIINEILPEQFVSMCLDRSQLSDSHFLKRVKEAKEISGDRLIIQADGAPMSGGKDNYNATLQAVACADIIQKSSILPKVLISGGTNSNSGKLSKLCDLTVHGISIGTFARNLVREEIRVPDFDSNLKAIHTAVKKANHLVNININEIKRD